MTSKSVRAEDFSSILGRLPEQFNEAAILGLRSSAMVLEGYVVGEIRKAKPSPAVMTGELAGSVVTRRVDDGADVVVEAPHGAFLEEGTRPHFPPLQPLIDWVKIKGLAGGGKGTRDKRGRFLKKKDWKSESQVEAAAKRIAYAIALKISRDGTAPRHFFAKAVARFESKGIIPREIARELDKVTG